MDIISHVIVTILLAETLVIKQTHTLPVPSERLQGKKLVFVFHFFYVKK